MRPRTKHDRELEWWQQELRRFALWYDGRIETLWGRAWPENLDRKPDAGWAEILAAFRYADRTRYADLLQIPGDRNYGRILDVGSGPLCPSTWLGGTTFAVEPLAREFIRLGYPMDAWGAVLVPHPAEDLWMLPSGRFDLVVANNSLDHVDHFERVAEEIERLAAPAAVVRLNICYRQEPTLSEPTVIDEARVRAAFRRIELAPVREHGPQESREVLWAAN